jgi:hypothetical protein
MSEVYAIAVRCKGFWGWLGWSELVFVSRDVYEAHRGMKARA